MAYIVLKHGLRIYTYFKYVLTYNFGYFKGLIRFNNYCYFFLSVDLKSRELLLLMVKLEETLVEALKLTDVQIDVIEKLLGRKTNRTVG